MVTMFRNKGDRRKIQKSLGYVFKNEKLLLRALTRRSALQEGTQASEIGDFQRLEFIGDRVLGLIVSNILFDNHPDWNEGQLTTALSNYVNNKGPLAKVAKNIGLGDYLIIGAGEEQNEARKNTKVLSDALEAVVGAIFVDSDEDYKVVKSFITTQFKTLGLVDFNQEYASAVTKMAAKAFAAELMADIMPEVYGPSGHMWEAGGVSLSELMQFKYTKERATKPLKGLPAAMDKYLSGGNDDDTIPGDDSDPDDFHDTEKKHTKEKETLSDDFDFFGFSDAQSPTTPAQPMTWQVPSSSRKSTSQTTAKPNSTGTPSSRRKGTKK